MLEVATRPVVIPNKQSLSAGRLLPVLRALDFDQPASVTPVTAGHRGLTAVYRSGHAPDFISRRQRGLTLHAACASGECVERFVVSLLDCPLVNFYFYVLMHSLLQWQAG